jgi:xanthine dehydrogenase YagT iron-sulfur-binding subunit
MPDSSSVTSSPGVTSNSNLAASPSVTSTSDAAAPVTAPLRALRLRVNGREQQLQVETWVTLLDLLRDRLGLTGSKKGCDHGQCGACTVLVNDRRINACLSLAVMHEGDSVTTVEGLASTDDAAEAGDPGNARVQFLHPLQQAFIDHDAFQCGYCTPGQLCSAAGLLGEHAPNSIAELRERMSGNLCRCGAYPQIVQAVWQVLQERGRPKGGDDHEGSRDGSHGGSRGAPRGGSNGGDREGGSAAVNPADGLAA